MKKKPLLLFLMFFCIMMFPIICRMEASASETLKKVSYTTRTYNVAITITPVCNSISLSFLNSDDEFDNVTVTDSQMLKRLNKKTSIIYFNKYESFSPVYGNDGLAVPFAENRSFIRPLLEQVTDTSHQPFIRRIFSLHDLLEQSKAAISHNASLSQRPDCLTDNEWTLAKLAASRLSNREIAAEMGFSEGTVKQYLNRIYGKLHIEGDNRNKR